MALQKCARQVIISRNNANGRLYRCEQTVCACAAKRVGGRALAKSTLLHPTPPYTQPLIPLSASTSFIKSSAPCRLGPTERLSLQENWLVQRMWAFILVGGKGAAARFRQNTASGGCVKGVISGFAVLFLTESHATLTSPSPPKK